MIDIYRVEVNGETLGIAETRVYIKQTGSGSYAPCDEGQAQGVCVKLPQTITDEGGAEQAVLVDTVFTLPGKVLGAEPEAVLTWLDGVVLLQEREAELTDTQAALALLGVSDEEATE